MSSEESAPFRGRLGRILNRGALAIALMGLTNAAIVFWFLERTEAHGTTILLAGRQQTLAREVLALAARRDENDPTVDAALRSAVLELDRSLTLLRDGGGDGGAEIPPAPSMVGPEIAHIERDWESLKSVLNEPGEIARAGELTDSLTRGADDLVVALRARRRLYRNVLALIAGATSLFFLVVSLMGARLFQSHVVDPVIRLQALARRAVDRKPPPPLTLPSDHELGGAVEAVSDLSARLEVVRNERDVAQAEYASVLDNSLAGIYRINASGRVSLANDALAELLGYESASELEESVHDAHAELFVDSDHRERFVDAGPNERLSIVETRMRRKDSTVVWVLESARRAQNADRDDLEGVVFDITPRREAFEALRRLTGRLMEVQDEERRRLARELHDSMGQLLAAMKMNLTRLDDETELPPSASELLRDSLELCEEASRQTRTMSHLLHPPLLEELGLEHAIRDFAAGFQQRSGVSVEVDLRVPDRLPSSLETCLFRFVQECLTNVHRHSGGERASIRLYRNQARLIAQVEDDGRGMPKTVWHDGELESPGVGLRGLHARLDQLGGTIVIETSSSGTSVTASVPLAPAAD